MAFCKPLKVGDKVIYKHTGHINNWRNEAANSWSVGYVNFSNGRMYAVSTFKEDEGSSGVIDNRPEEKAAWGGVIIRYCGEDKA